MFTLFLYGFVTLVTGIFFLERHVHGPMSVTFAGAVNDLSLLIMGLWLLAYSAFMFSHCWLKQRFDAIDGRLDDLTRKDK